MNTKHLPIYKSGYELVMLITEQVRHFSRDFRPTLGRRMQDEAMNMVMRVYRANVARDKVPHITLILESAAMLEMQLQLAFDLRLISPKGYARAIEITEGVQRQAGGWRKSSEHSRIKS